MLTEKPLSSKQKAEAQTVHLGEPAGPWRKVPNRAARRAFRRPNRKQSGRRSVHVDLGLFNIAIGRREPLPRA